VIFIAAALAGASPIALSKAISENTGINYTEVDATPYSPLRSGMGSNIVHFSYTSKVYCAKHNPLYYQQGLSDY
ncbi:MAG: hypothetical protein OEV35_08925, partial [Gallionellaceae bacterium]|nr:hypothetical protein [Gallionellaceae bacterium]